MYLIHMRVQLSKHETFYLANQIHWYQWNDETMMKERLIDERGKVRKYNERTFFYFLACLLALRCVGEIERRQSGGCWAVSPMTDSRPYSAYKHTPTVVLLWERRSKIRRCRCIKQMEKEKEEETKLTGDGRKKSRKLW